MGGRYRRIWNDLHKLMVYPCHPEIRARFNEPVRTVFVKKCMECGKVWIVRRTSPWVRNGPRSTSKTARMVWVPYELAQEETFATVKVEDMIPADEKALMRDEALMTDHRRQRLGHDAAAESARRLGYGDLVDAAQAGTGQFDWLGDGEPAQPAAPAASTAFDASEA